MQSNNYIKDIETVLSTVIIKNFFSYSWLNEVIVPIPSDLKRDLPEELVKMQLIHSLTQNLYTNFYCKGFIASTKRFSTRMSLPTVKVDYLKQLSSSNNGKGYLDDKWTVISRESDRVVAVKNGCRLILKTCEYLSPENKPGGNVFQCMPKDLHFLSPGFLMAVGNNDLQLIDACPTIRFYWNLRAQGAIPLMSAITTKLNKAGLPFRFKILDQPDQFIRCDSAVLYTFRKDYELIRNAIESVHSEVMPYLKYETPVFTKNLAFGLGLAESPEHGNSFGIHRCQILAEGIVNAFCHNQKSVAKRLTVVRQYFEEKEINLEKPYLNPGSADIFHFDSGKISNRYLLKKREEPNQKPDDQALIETAFKIGVLLSSKAFWHKGRCTWMALTQKTPLYQNDEPINLIYSTVGPDLYSGTSGIALFLAELYCTTGDSSMRSLALGAIRQSLSNIDGIEANLSLGLYNGMMGVAFASAYIGKLLGEEQLLKSASQILNAVLIQQPQIELLDQIGGSAGAINAFLILKDILNDNNLFAIAKTLGDGLVANAICRDNYCSWKSPGFPKQQNLLGFSHGTAGIAHALIELFDATGESNYKKMAESAFNYENYWYNKGNGNWPDFRGVKASATQNASAFNFPVFWCHGAPGIAISRLQAHSILGNDKYKVEALSALKITEESTSDMLNSEQVNYCLCHGLNGNADILLTGSEVLGKEFSRGYEVACDVAHRGMKYYAKQNRWPFGVLGDNSPGLMLGLAGVGLFYLRLQNAEIPSILAFNPKKILHRLNTVNGSVSE